MSNLSPQQFHGSTHDFAPGDKVLPNDQVGAHSDSRSGAKAYATTHEDTAWSFAGWNAKRGKRPRVFTVTPGPNAKSGFDPKENRSTGEVEADHFTVTGAHDTQPGHQGTFPQLNWAQFSTRHDDHAGFSVNHPDPGEEDFGPYKTYTRQEAAKPAPLTLKEKHNAKRNPQPDLWGNV
jgi:hypothetical protein